MATATGDVCKICPSVAELDAEIERNVPCLIGGCGKVFKQGAARRLHMVKVHRVVETDADRAMYSKKKKDSCTREEHIVEYHCPVQTCYFNINSPRHFSSLKNLKSHYLKVHTERRFECQRCNNLYRLERELRVHEKKCDLNFYCSACNTFFDTMNELRAHKDTAHSGGIKPNQRTQQIVLPDKKRNDDTLEGAGIYKAKKSHGETSLSEKHTNQCMKNVTNTSSGKYNANTNTAPEIAKLTQDTDADALETLASVAVERETSKNNNHQAYHVVIQTSPQKQPCNMIVLGAPQSAPYAASETKGIPILPKPQTLFLPVEYDIEDGNRFVIKTGPTVAICDLRPNAQPVTNHNVLRPIKPKLTESTQFISEPNNPNTAGSMCSQDRVSTPFYNKKELVSVGIQTGGMRKSKAMTGTQTVKRTKIVMETETQTSGDYILRKAMKSANILTDNKSCGTHFASLSSPPSHNRTVVEIPRKSLKRRNKTLSAHHSTQTLDVPPLKRHRPRKPETVTWLQTEAQEITLPNNQAVQAIQTVHTGELVGPVLSVREIGNRQPLAPTQQGQTQHDTSVNTDALEFSSIETQTLQSLGISHNTTQAQTQTLSQTQAQTQTLLDELEKTLAESISTQTFQDPLGESISTQTLNSFLATSTTAKQNVSEPVASTSHSDNQSQNSSFGENSQNASFTSTFTSPESRDPIIGHPVGHMVHFGDFGVQTDAASPLSNFLSSSSAQTSFFDDTAAFTSIETQTVDDMFQQLLLSNMHTQTADDFLDSLELSNIQTQTHVTMENNDSFETSTQTHVAMETSHAESQTSVTMDTNHPSLDMKTQTLVTRDSTSLGNQSESGTQTFLSTRVSSTVETQTQFQRTQAVSTNPVDLVSVGTSSHGTQCVGTSSLEFAETETQTLLETLGLNGDPTHSQTQTSWNELSGQYL